MPGEQVDEQIARDAGPVVAVVPPAEQAHRIEWPLRRVAEKAIPVDRLRRGVGRDRILPRAHRGVAVDPRFDEIQFAGRAGAEQLPRLRVDDRAGVLAADLENPAGLPRRLDDAGPFVERLHDRLLDVDVLGCLHRVDRHLRVPVIRRRDNHRIDVGPRQHLPVVARREHMVAPQLFGERQPPVVDVGGRHQLDPGRAKRRAHVLLAADPQAEHGDPDPIVRRHALRCGPRLCPQERRRRGDAGHRLEKITA